MFESFFLAKAILGILDSQIETKRIFYIVGIFKGLHHCQLRSKNVDLLVLPIKNWPNDPCIGFEVKKGPQDVDEFGEIEEEILDLLNVKFLNEVEDHVEDCVQHWDMYP
jgi:hypothetical protein